MAVVYNIVGPQVRKYRELRGLTQKELAAKCHVRGWDISRDVVATIEARSRRIGDFELVLLSQVLDVPISDLLPERVSWREMGMSG